MLLTITVLRVDFGPMKNHEMNAIAGDLFTTPGRPYEDNEEEIIKENSHVLDLVLPVVVLIISCIVAMIYTGGFFTGASFVEAFANSSASVGLVLGGSVTLAFTFVYYMMRDVLSFREFTECIPDGFKSMIAPIMILTLAWTLSGMTNLLGAKIFVADLVEHSAQGMQGFLPMIIFLVAAFLAFATGTSWGTFSILIPIVIGVFPSGQMMAISISSCLAGAVCGDHCSPISDRIFYHWCAAGSWYGTTFSYFASDLYCDFSRSTLCDSCKDRWKRGNLKFFFNKTALCGRYYISAEGCF